MGRASGDSQLPAPLNRGSVDANNDLAYDPIPFLLCLTTPFLYVFGSEDINIPAQSSVTRLEELTRMGLPLTYAVIEGEGHELGGPSPLPPFYRFAEGYAELITQYAHAQVNPD